MSVKRTKARISYTFFWQSLNEDCRDYIKTCSVCQLKAPVTHRDRVPITPIPRADRVFDHFLLIAWDLWSQVKVRRLNTTMRSLLLIVSVDFRFVTR